MHDVISTTTFFIKDGLNYLQLDHDRFEMMFQAFQDASSMTERREIIAEIARQVSEHISLEEEYLNPLIRRLLDNGDEWVRQLSKDDQSSKEILQYLTEIGEEDMHVDIYEKEVEKLFAHEREHMKLEELEIFPILRTKMNEDQLEVLYDSLERSKKTSLKPNKVPIRAAGIMGRTRGSFGNKEKSEV